MHTQDIYSVWEKVVHFKVQTTCRHACVCPNLGRPCWRQHSQSGSVFWLWVMSKVRDFLPGLVSTEGARMTTSLQLMASSFSRIFLLWEGTWRSLRAQVNWNSAWPWRWRTQSQAYSWLHHLWKITSTFSQWSSSAQLTSTFAAIHH